MVHHLTGTGARVAAAKEKTAFIVDTALQAKGRREKQERLAQRSKAREDGGRDFHLIHSIFNSPTKMSEPAKKKQKTSHTAIIAEPLADKKLTKRILKLNKKGACA